VTGLDILDVVGNIAGVGALAVFVVLGYRVFQQSVSRSQEIDDNTINELRKQIDASSTREDALRARLDDMEKKLTDLSDDFNACKEDLVLVRAYMKLNHGIDPDDITGYPV